MNENESESMRILFVDDEPRVLDGLRRMLRGRRELWHMRFCEGPLLALEALQQEPFDVVVTDMRMPVMDGAELLSRIREQYPQTIRIVLSGQSEQERVLRAVGPAHQYLSKPCNPEELRETIVKASRLGKRLDNPMLKSLVSKLSVLPSLPKLYTELVEELAKEDCSVGRIGTLISQDIGMTAKLLQLVNSSFFGLPVHVVDIKHAVALLGTNTIRQLVMAAGVFRQTTGSGDKQLFLRQLFDHSMIVASIAKVIAVDAGLSRESVDNAFLAGVLHDIGKLVFNDNFAAEYAQIQEQSKCRESLIGEAEVAAFGASHADVGGYLLGLWGLPHEIIEAVAFHHDPRSSPAETLAPLTAVHLANAICHEAPDNGPISLDMDYVCHLKIEDRLDSWRAMAAETAAQTGPGALV
jgi:putative nucleotidyltransferase with HDIG domain